MQKLLKVALIQFAPKSYEVQNNLDKALKLAHLALEQGARLIVLPELYDSAYCVEDQDEKFSLNLHQAHPNLDALQKLAKNYQAYIVACSIEKDTQLYDSAYIISHKGLLGVYRKIYLWGNEKERFTRGDKYPIFELEFENFKLKLGLQICYEIGFSEGSRFLALQGAEIICFPSAFGKARTYVWNLASRSRALENGVFVLAANRSGSEISKINNETLTFAGKSKIINPKGEIIKEILEEEGFIIAELDLEEVQIQRKNLPYLKDLNLKLNQEILTNIHLNTKE
ncbi:carbon-nitrogen hydrolase family protein [Campylobacter coli]|nr:carbon-nitrogen hydrolase family protein [Campylobacter coli]